MWTRVLLHLFHGAVVEFELEVEGFRYGLVGDVVVPAETSVFFSSLPFLGGRDQSVCYERDDSYVGPMPPLVTTKS
jgi:hypothetical protein